MNAKTARLMTNNKASERDAKKELLIRKDVNEILETIKKTAKNGGSQCLFGTNHVQYNCDIGEVKKRLEKLGYYFIEEGDMGLEYEMICW